MIKTACAVLLLALSTQCRAEVLFIKDGFSINAAILSASSSTVMADGGFSVPVKKVNLIHFAELEPITSDYFKIIPEKPGEGAALRRQVKAFRAKFPDAQSLILKEDTAYTLREDGTWLCRYRVTVALLTTAAVEMWKQHSEYLDDGRERVKILKATVYMPDGNVLPFDQANLSIANPQSEDGMFTDQASLIYTFPSLASGAIIDLITEREVFSPFNKNFFFPYAVRLNLSPIKSWVFSVSVPRGKKFYYAAVNFGQKSPEPKISSSGDETTYRWELNNLGQIIAEGMMPPYEDVNPQVKGALTASWDPVYDWIAPQYLNRMEPDAALTALAKGITANAKDENAKISLLYHYVQKTIRYNAVKLGMQSNWAGYDAQTTWQRKYGCCIDKVILLAAMLKAVDIKAEPFVLNPFGSPEHDYRIPDMDFEHAILRVQTGNGILYLDPTENDFAYPYMHPRDYNVTGIAPLSRTTDYVEPPAAHENLTRYTYRIIITPGLATKVQFTARYFGPTEGVKRSSYRSMAPVERDHVLKEWIKGMAPGAELEKAEFHNIDDIETPFYITAEFTLKDHIIEAGHLKIFGLPGFECNYGEAGTDSRAYPIKYSLREQVFSLYEIEYPKDFDVEAIQPSLDIKTPFGYFKLGIEKERSRIIYNAMYERSALSVRPDEYSRYKQFLNAVSRATRDRIFFSLVLK
ncbi:MAG: DUF3857 domain-containing protein [Elusimicrobiaceae bacterium]